MRSTEAAAVITEVFLRDETDECWRWNPVEWSGSRLPSAPTSACPSIRRQHARLPPRLTGEAHNAIDTGKHNERHVQAGSGGDAGKRAKPQPRRGKSVPQHRATRTHPGRYEFDSAFGRATWIRGTSGAKGEYGGEGNTCPHLVLDHGAGRHAGSVYTPEERSKNAGAQPRDANGRFVKMGGSVHVTGNQRTAKIIKVDREKGEVTIQYPDGTTQVKPASEVTNISSDKPDTGPDERTTKINPDDYGAESRATKITPKAWLDKLLPVLDRAELDRILADFQAYIEEMRKRNRQDDAVRGARPADHRCRPAVPGAGR